MRVYMWYNAVNWKGELDELHVYTDVLMLVENIEDVGLGSKRSRKQLLEDVKQAKDGDTVGFGDDAIFVKEI